MALRETAEPTASEIRGIEARKAAVLTAKRVRGVNPDHKTITPAGGHCPACGRPYGKRRRCYFCQRGWPRREIRKYSQSVELTNHEVTMVRQVSDGLGRSLSPDARVRVLKALLRQARLDLEVSRCS